MKATGAICALLLAALPSTVLAEPVSGQWLTDAKDSVVMIDRCGQKMCGKIARVLDSTLPTKDIYNPDASLRSRPIIGTMVLRDFSGSGSQWEDGQAYDPKTGKSYRSKMRLLANGDLRVTGCILFLCQNRLWTRIPAK